MRFSDIVEPRPTRDGLAEAYRSIDAMLDRDERDAALALWDRERRHYESWAALDFLPAVKPLAGRLMKLSKSKVAATNTRRKDNDGAACPT